MEGIECTLLALVLLLSSAVFFIVKLKGNHKKKDLNTLSTKKKSREKRTKHCPFSKHSNFLVEIAEHVDPSPLEMFEDWENVDSFVGNGDLGNKRIKPLAARWLNASLSGQDTPGMLRSGLKRLRDSKHFLVQDRHRFKYELLLKKKVLDNLDQNPHVFVAEPDSLDAQRECLELFLDYLPRRFPDLYNYDKDANSIKVSAIDTIFNVNDYWYTKPLELCERIVQEDLVLMRPGDCVSDGIQSYHMAAAAVVFSFNGLKEKLGKPAEFIHAPVPGFEKFLRKSLNLTFSKLRSEKPVWRNNWGIAPTGNLVDCLDAHKKTFDTSSIDEVKSKFLRVEYQTLRRLPRSKYLLFTVRTMVDPLTSLESVPVAAKCLAYSIRGMSSDMLKYKGIDGDKICEAILAYLDSIK